MSFSFHESRPRPDITPEYLESARLQKIINDTVSSVNRARTIDELGEIIKQAISALEAISSSDSKTMLTELQSISAICSPGVGISREDDSRAYLIGQDIVNKEKIASQDLGLLAETKTMITRALTGQERN